MVFSHLGVRVPVQICSAAPLIEHHVLIGVGDICDDSKLAIECLQRSLQLRRATEKALVNRDIHPGCASMIMENPVAQTE